MPEAAPPVQSSDLVEAANSISSPSNFSQWKKMKRIGCGGFGIVSVALNSETKELCAIKEMFDRGDPRTAKCLHQEIQILGQLKHPNIVKYYDSEIVGNQISLYMEYVRPGSLRKYISARGPLEEPLVGEFTKQILSGLLYLHSQRVVHRDIKANNLLVDSYNNVVKLADFGLAKHLDLSVGNHSEKGTIHYTAPEILEDKEYSCSGQAFASDIWSLGCTVIEMLTGKPPWRHLEQVQVMFKVCIDNQNPPIPETLSVEGKDFLELCFKRNPSERPSAKELLGHSFVTGRPQVERARTLSEVLEDELDDDITVLNPTHNIQIGTEYAFEAANSISSTTNYSQWQKIRCIWRDEFGFVSLACNRKTGELCAVKELFDNDDPRFAKFVDEIQILSQLEHPNIVKYYGCEIVGNQIFLYTEYVQRGTLKKFISELGAFEESLVRKFTAKILCGLAYLHSQRVVHRAIRADNVLVDSYYIVKLGCFGLAKHLHLSAGNHSIKGTIYWTAPEIVECKEYSCSGQAFAADIWSLGCVIIEMLTGKHPWHGLEQVQAIRRVCYDKQNPPIPETLSREGKEFLELCFKRNPAERPSAKALLEHPFVKERGC